LRAERPDHVWALDYQFDVTADGRILKAMHVVDEFTRPEFLRCDNGPELTSNALKDWCRFGHTGYATALDKGSGPLLCR
jgi:putative transposase